MALRFRTPHIEDLPTTHTRQAPGFAWVPVASGASAGDPSWGTSNRKRQRTSAIAPSTSETHRARQARETERRLKELNSEGVGATIVTVPKKAGKTANTKKILQSGKGFAHYLDDEEAELARTGGVPDVVMSDAPVQTQQRASKTPIARRKPSTFTTTASTHNSTPTPSQPPPETDDDIPELAALLSAPPLPYNAARSAPPPASAPPPRNFCEMCGFWGRVRCNKCGNWTCSVVCKDAHDEGRCLKFYA